MSEFSDSAVIIFAKLPAAGKVKTRLAAETGSDTAVAFYKHCASHIFDEVEKLKTYGIECYLFYGSGDDAAVMKKWINKNFVFTPQSEGDLGDKMSSAFQNVFAHGKKKILIIGTDIPDITKEIFLNAFTALDKDDIVISPSYDGGYNFLGMKDFYPSLFENIKWSTPEVYPATLNKINELGLRVKAAESFADIDNKKDLTEWLADSNTGNVRLKKIIGEIVK